MKNKNLRAKIVRILPYIVIVLVFLAQALFFASHVSDKVYPDESYHVTLSQKYSKEGYPVTNDEDTYWMGEISMRPPLYHMIMGGVLNVNVIGMDEVLLLRYVNVLFALGSVVTAIAVAKLFFEDRMFRVLAVLILASTPMFAFLSGAVNYDNLLILLSMLSLLGTALIIRKKSYAGLMLLISALSVGGLVKHTVLPLIPVMVVIAFWFLKPWTSDFWKNFGKYMVENKLRTVFLVLALLSLAAFTAYYGRNIIKYQNVIPECKQVISEEECSKSKIQKRNLAIQEEMKDVPRMSIPSYIYNWGKIMVRQIFGYTGHKYVWPSPSQMIPVFIILGIFATGSVLAMILSDRSVIIPLLGISIFYILVLMFYQNYRGYLETGSIYVAVQGRYLFPVLYSIYIVPLMGISGVNRKWIKYAVGITVGVCFVLMSAMVFVDAYQLSESGEVPMFDLSIEEGVGT